MCVAEASGYRIRTRSAGNRTHITNASYGRAFAKQVVGKHAYVHRQTKVYYHAVRHGAYYVSHREPYSGMRIVVIATVYVVRIHLICRGSSTCRTIIRNIRGSGNICTLSYSP